jgi:hypothetical protein
MVYHHHVYSASGVCGIHAKCDALQREENSLIITFKWALLKMVMTHLYLHHVLYTDVWNSFSLPSKLKHHFETERSEQKC